MLLFFVIAGEIDTSTNGGSITIIGDSMLLGTTNAGSGHVNLTQRTIGTPIDLASVIDLGDIPRTRVRYELEERVGPTLEEVLAPLV